MEPAHDITQNMEDLTIKPKARAVTPYATTTTTMESTNRITQEMEDMTLNPKARAVTQYTATTSTNAHSVFSQLQLQSNSSSTAPITTNTTGGYTYTTTSAGLSFSNPDASSSRSSPPAPFVFAAGPTGGYAYATSPTGLTFSNPNASSSSSTTTTTSITTTTSQPQAQTHANHLLNCDDPIGFYKFSLYHSHFPSLSHSAINRITKSRSTSSLRERYRQQRRPLVYPATGTTVYKAMIGKVPGTKIIYTTTAEEEAEEEEKGRMTMAFFENCLQRTKARVAAEKAAKAARERQMQSGSGMGACGEAWFPTVQERAKITYVNGEGDVVEESWEKASPPMPWGEASEGSHGMDDVEESIDDDDDEMME